MKHWKTIKSEYLLRDRWLTVRADACVTAEGVSVSPYYVLEYSDWVHIVALDSANQVLVTRQYRHAAGKVCAELPCGVIESEETPLAAARRELQEETGCTAREFEQLASLCPNPATHSNTVHCFLALGAAVTTPPNPDQTEDITCEFLSVRQVMDMIDTGKFCQALHIASLMLALRKHGMLGEESDNQ